jgi:catechol 2,3-dioxygenase-like lactoylglutathione lyase family enzyme
MRFPQNFVPALCLLGMVLAISREVEGQAQTGGNMSVRYIVNDIDAAIAFYTTYLGFQVDLHPGPGFANLSRGNLHLFLNKPGAGGAGQPMPDGRKPEPGGWNRIRIEVRDLASEVDALRKAGARFRNDIVIGNGGKQILLEDPSGNPIELFEPPANARPAASSPTAAATTSPAGASRTLTISIDAPAEKVYAFASQPANFPKWVTSFVRSATKTADGGWVLDTADGKVSIAFAPANPYGVLDHVVRPERGGEVRIPMRVIPNGPNRCEVLFTLFQLPDMSREKFAGDAEMVQRDLATLKRIAEQP